MVIRNCQRCGQSIPIIRHATAKYCSDDCQRLNQIDKYHQLNPQTYQSKTASGAISEYKVIIDLLIRGFEVFRSVEPGSTCDLATLKNGQLLRIEVKTVKYNASGIPYRVTKPIKADVLAMVLNDKIIYEPDIH